MEIAARSVSAGYGGRAVLAGIDLAIESGEMVGLLGPNGAGKSTLLRTLAGLAAPLAGEVRYDGWAAAAIGARTLARRIAYLAQGGEVAAALGVEQIVALGRLPHRGRFGGLSARDHEAVARALSRADAASFAGRPFATLSGGERARVLLARALAVESEILLADEPIAALDPLHQLQMLDVLREAVARGLGVVVVLHDLTLAARFCDRLVLVSGGAILRDGPAATVLTDAVLESAYGIEVARSVHGGEPFLVPWRPARSRPGTEAS